MIKTVQSNVWAFDLEWVPSAQAGRILYGLPAEMEEKDVLLEMWKRNGATAEDPMPFLKMVLCRVVSVAAVTRTVRNNEVSLRLIGLPQDPADPEQASERAIVGRFLQGIGKNKPQLVGFNSKASDLKILLQRGIVLGLHAPEFCQRPQRRDDPTPDYFARWDGDSHVDLMELVTGFGKGSAVSLNELAALSGIPGKFKTEGTDVAGLWLAGRHKEIVQYNCHDAITTYLLWLRMAHFSGHFTAEQYAEEQELLRDLLMTRAEEPEGAHLEAYLEEWDRLQALTGQL